MPEGRHTTKSSDCVNQLHLHGLKMIVVRVRGYRGYSGISNDKRPTSLGILLNSHNRLRAHRVVQCGNSRFRSSNRPPGSNPQKMRFCPDRRLAPNSANKCIVPKPSIEVCARKVRLQVHTSADGHVVRHSVGKRQQPSSRGTRGSALKSRTYSKHDRICKSSGDRQEAGIGTSDSE